jgi:hypothetical protein
VLSRAASKRTQRLQERLDENNDPGRFYVSQWLFGQAVEANIQREKNEDAVKKGGRLRRWRGKIDEG